MSGDLTERARQLSAEAEHLHSVTKRRKETLVAARKQALAVTGEAVRAVYEPLEAEGIVRGTPVLLPEPAPTNEPPARPPAKADEEASYEERPVTRRSRRP